MPEPELLLGNQIANGHKWTRRQDAVLNKEKLSAVAVAAGGKACQNPFALIRVHSRFSSARICRSKRSNQGVCPMKRALSFFMLLVIPCVLALPLQAQVLTFTREQLIKFTE